MGSKENVGNGEDRNYSLAAVVSPLCATVKHLIKQDRETKKADSGGKKGEGHQFDSLQSPAALEEQPDRLEGVSG